MDLVTSAQLWYFGALFAGLALGALVGRFSHFERGLGVGLLLPGLVAAWFGWLCVEAYQAFEEGGANAVAGEVIAVEDEPANASGSITRPVPRIRYTAPDQSVHEIRGPASSGFDKGEAVVVLHEPADPERSRVGQPPELRGAAIAMMLFGTFPLTLGIFFLYGSLFGTRDERRLAARAEASEGLSPLRSRLLRDGTAAFYFAMLAAILWIAFGTGELEGRFVLGFGGMALALAGYALRALFDPALDTVWVLGVLVLSINFGVWAYALHLLT